MVNYKQIRDWYGVALREPEEKPTLIQCVSAWALVNELADLGYPMPIRGLPRKADVYNLQLIRVIDKARAVIRMAKGEEHETHDRT